MPGGPEDGTIIPSFGGHMASYIWGGKERNVWRCLSRTQLCSELVNWRGRLAQEHLELIDGSGLSHLPGIMFKRLDWSLIYAFVKRWQPNTNTFHMPFGEIMIMLHDVYHILGLRVDVLGGSLFLYKSGNCTHPSFLHELVVEGVTINEYSWGSATLAYLYRQLGTTSRKDANSIAGCLTLLLHLIYEYFPCFQPQQGTLTRELDIPRASAWDVGSGCPNKSMERLLAFRARLDELTDREVNWLPYGVDPARHVPPTLFIGCIQYHSIIESYMPDRVVQQLGFVQDIQGALSGLRRLRDRPT
ncbi:protein MAIN-LIKE 1-like [Chenopodium quinoa]|uniref:protein MAIN-LIKE 1-like n=1 Tax=Chenopodium quinoa TaxID=63459 RepID=UPI000B78C4CF|nr:protein MAIN-LIKE 1-like [Chenopodium quinoa]